jgi:hypothetical protein
MRTLSRIHSFIPEPIIISHANPEYVYHCIETLFHKTTIVVHVSANIFTGKIINTTIAIYL